MREDERFNLGYTSHAFQYLYGSKQRGEEFHNGTHLTRQVEQQGGSSERRVQFVGLLGGIAQGRAEGGVSTNEFQSGQIVDGKNVGQLVVLEGSVVRGKGNNLLGIEKEFYHIFYADLRHEGIVVDFSGTNAGNLGMYFAADNYFENKTTYNHTMCPNCNKYLDIGLDYWDTGKAEKTFRIKGFRKKLNESDAPTKSTGYRNQRKIGYGHLTDALYNHFGGVCAMHLAMAEREARKPMKSPCWQLNFPRFNYRRDGTFYVEGIGEFSERGGGGAFFPPGTTVQYHRWHEKIPYLMHLLLNVAVPVIFCFA